MVCSISVSLLILQHREQTVVKRRVFAGETSDADRFCKLMQQLEHLGNVLRNDGKVIAFMGIAAISFVQNRLACIALST